MNLSEENSLASRVFLVQIGGGGSCKLPYLLFTIKTLLYEYKIYNNNKKQNYNVFGNIFGENLDLIASRYQVSGTND